MQIQKILGFKPSLIPTILTIPALILLISLGMWQLQRLHYKEKLIDEIKHQNQLVTIELPVQISLPDMLYRKVKLHGEFLNQQEMHIYGGNLQFKGKVGYYIITPMRLTDNRIVIVNRGWVPDTEKEAITRPASLITGITEVEGAIMQSEQKSLYIHENQPERNLWFYMNLDEMQHFLNEPIESFYILAKDNPNISPRGRDLEPNLRNNHLGYALTWFSLAIALLAIYVIYHRKLNQS